MKKILFIGFLCSFLILFSQAKNVHYTDFIDFTDSSGVEYNCMMITDEHGDDGRADATVRILYNTDDNEHLIEFYSDCYYEKLKNGNTRISFIPTANTPVKIIKGKDVSYNPDTFIYEIDSKTSKITGKQSDKSNSPPVPIFYRNIGMSTEERMEEINKFYFRAEPMYGLLKNFFDKKMNDANKINSYYDALGWFGSDGTAYQAFVVTLYKNQQFLNGVVRIRYEKDGEIKIVEYDATCDLVVQKDDSVSISIEPKTTEVRNIKGNAGYNPDSFSYTVDANDKFISGKQSDDNSTADLSYIKITNRAEFALKFYSEKDEIYQKYLK
ncbi:hypothetical protein D1631_07615 [Chryseobacterium nematophagum]|uniref:Uncharacterized protein n=1 Tax=Chryseobacterium nematophagum TaxID=2305228 RepID=A0A3M7TET2_9FLAO|nr:hypothetical protein [Chryseobacterium nematophagum]RNA61808.1 hypothetical protein D1631_07615 [Chryseobacterium nematophagum]